MPEKLTKKNQNEVLADDRRYYGRQLLNDLRILERNPTTGAITKHETETEARSRMGLEGVPYEEFTRIDELGDVKQLTGAELIARFTAEKICLLVPERNPATGEKTGKMVRETPAQLDQRISNGPGVKKEKGLAFARDELLKASGLRGARENRASNFKTIDDATMISEWEKNHDIIYEWARALPWERFQYLLIKGDKIKVSQEQIIKMWQIRRGDYARMIAEVQARLDDGGIIKDGEPYNDMLLAAYQEQTRYMTNDEEFMEFLKVKAPILDESGKPYTMTVKKDGSVKVRRDGVGDPLTFENLRQTVLFWQGSSSTKFAKYKDSLTSDDEKRNVGTRKRTPVADLRDEYNMLAIAFGEETSVDGKPNEFVLPKFGNDTAEFDAPKRAREWAQKLLDEAQIVIDAGTATPEDMMIAQEKRKRALLLLEGPQDFSELRGLKPKERDRAIYDAREKLRATLPANRRALINSSKLYYLLNRQIIIEGGYPENATRGTGMVAWHKGKNLGEEGSILGKREYHSAAIVFGLTLQKLQELLDAKGTDQEEIDALSYLLLVYKDMAFINGCIASDNIKNKITWPDNPELLKKIQDQRDRRFPPDIPGNEPLQLDPFEAERRKQKKDVEDTAEVVEIE